MCACVQSFDFVAHQTGAYQFCFDNTMSRWTAKVVDMELMVHGAFGRSAYTAMTFVGRAHSDVIYAPPRSLSLVTFALLQLPRWSLTAPHRKTSPESRRL